MGKNVAVFVDVANIFYAAKAAGVDIDYVTLLKAATAGRDLVRAYAYTGLDPENENQRNFHDFLRRHGYKVVSKDIRKYGDGKVKANLDIELVVDMMKTARNLDIAIVISGDGDFAPAIRAVQEMGVRCEVISFRGNTSSDLIDVADQFTEIAQIARVEKGSSRSGRRVADDEEDLSMTEVPDKQSEGTGARSRGRGRSRAKPVEAEPVVAAPRTRRRVAARAGEVAVAAGDVVAAGGAVIAVTSSGAPLVVLPGEKLSRVAAVAPVAPVAAPDDEYDEDDAAADAIEAAAGEIGAEGGDEARPRRRRRRGGRGRGRGRDGATASADAAPGASLAGDFEDEDDEEADEPSLPVRAPAPPKRVAQAFGSVWDSQIGTPAPSSGPAASVDEEDIDEPPIPEYLISERRGTDRRPAGGARSGGRGARGGYAAAIDRERYGGGRSGGPSRFAEPAPRGGSGRDVPRFRDDRPAPRPAPRGGSSDEPWSEVPPEIEAMLRAQIGGRPARSAAPAPTPTAIAPTPAAEDVAPSARRAGRRAPASSAATAEAPMPEAAAPPAKRRVTRKPAAAAPPEPVEPAPAAAANAAPKRRSPRAAAASDGAPGDAPAASAPADSAPKRRAPRKAAGTADA